MTILTCVSAAGVVGTSVLTAKAATKASKLLDQAKEEKGEDLTKMEIVQVAGPAYIPAIALGVTTVASIVGIGLLSKRQNASIISSYTLLDQAYKNYRAKVEEMYGENADNVVRNEIAKDRFEESGYVKEFEDKQLFYEEFSGRYFESTIEDVKDAEYHFNRNFALRGYADLNEFYEFLGLEEVEYGFYMGWSQWVGEAEYGYKWVDFTHQMIDTESGEKCCVIRMPFEPHYDYLDDNY